MVLVPPPLPVSPHAGRLFLCSLGPVGEGERLESPGAGPTCLSLPSLENIKAPVQLRGDANARWSPETSESEVLDSVCRQNPLQGHWVRRRGPGRRWLGCSSPQCTVGFAHFAGTGSCCRDEAAPGPVGLLAVLIMLQPSEVPLR